MKQAVAAVTSALALVQLAETFDPGDARELRQPQRHYARAMSMSMVLVPPPGVLAAVRGILTGALQAGRNTVGAAARAMWAEMEGWAVAGLGPLVLWLESLFIAAGAWFETRMTMRLLLTEIGQARMTMRLLLTDIGQAMLGLLEAGLNTMRAEVTRLGVAAASASRSLLLLLLAPLHTRRLGLLFCCGVAFVLAWAAATISLGRLTDMYNAKQAKGLYLRKRPVKRRCPNCAGFGIEPCDLCGSTGFRIYEMKFIYTDPCPNEPPAASAHFFDPLTAHAAAPAATHVHLPPRRRCFSRRWQWCGRCGGSGCTAEPWTAWAAPRIIYTLFPGPAAVPQSVAWLDGRAHGAGPLSAVQLTGSAH
ncbi:hypothetical protein JKP88DRAFT_347574 [Tribonema minus]|uniref:Uncharacterized protein n=1 Tax=Tribonema minus TaxID=303371 RepID=A0A835ZJW3_9STRA|nr:hypothetical protein JKP88DRAFT_347574 [Tribonema minus]